MVSLNEQSGTSYRVCAGSPPAMGSILDNRPTQGYYSRQTSIASQFYLGARGLNWEQSAKVFSRCSMKIRTFAEIRRLAGRTATIGTVRSKGVNRRRTVPSRSSAANSHAGACAIPRCSRTPILICSISLVLKTPVGIIRFAFCPDPILYGWADPRSTKTTAGKRRRSSGDSGMPYRMTY